MMTHIRLTDIQIPVELITLSELVAESGDQVYVALSSSCEESKGAVTTEFYPLERVLLIRCAHCRGIVGAVRVQTDG